MISLTLLGWAFGSVAFLVSAATGSTGLSYAVVGALAVLSFVIHSFSQIVEVIEPLRWISLFFYYTDSSPLSHGLNWWHALVPLVVVGVSYVLARILFEKRDMRSAG